VLWEVITTDEIGTGRLHFQPPPGHVVNVSCPR
jgi:hypothetical protein